jgi:hypothetical protein
VGDGSPLAATLIVGRGSRGGSTSPSGVTAGEGDPSGWRARRGCSPRGYVSCIGSPPKDRKVTLPAVTFASEVVSTAQIQPSRLHVPWRQPSHGRRRLRGWKLGYSMDLGTHGGVCGLAMEGRRPVDLGMKVADRSISHGICGVQHTDPVT